MELKKAKKTKWAIEDFFYKSRFNIALNEMLESQKFSGFRNKLEDALYKQILYFAKVEKVNQIVGVAKAVQRLDSDESDLLENVRRYWIPILSLLDEEEVFNYLFWANEKGGQAALDKLKSEDIFHLTNESMIKKIRDRVLNLQEEIDGTTQDWIARTVAQGMRSGLSHVEIAKAIRDMARKTAEERAALIAENETALALEESLDEVFRRNGIEKHRWITQRDELVCDICMANEDAGIIRVGELFPNGVSGPPAHPRCRCIDMPVIPDNLNITWTGK